jgi:hypothetical protein
MGLAIERLGFSAAWIVIAVVPLAALVGTFFMLGEERFATEFRSSV